MIYILLTMNYRNRIILGFFIKFLLGMTEYGRYQNPGIQESNMMQAIKAVFLFILRNKSWLGTQVSQVWVRRTLLFSNYCPLVDVQCVI